MMSDPQVSNRGGFPVAVGRMSAVVAGGWILFSRFAIDHRLILPEALSANRKQASFSTYGRLSYYVDETEPGTPLLLIHSINAAASTFEVKPLFEHYRTQRPVYALDLPGYGFSERADRVYSAELFVDTIAEFVKQEIGTAVDVVAMSLSAEFIASASLKYPDIFRSMAMLSPTGFNAKDVSIPGWFYNVFGFPLWSQALFDLIVVKGNIRFFLNRNFEGEVPPEMVDYAHATSHQPGARYAPIYFVSGQLFTPGIRNSAYEKVSIPTLVIYDRDPNVQFDKLPDLLQKNAYWQAVRVAPTLGLAHWEKLDEVVDALDNFWASLFVDEEIK